MLSKVSLACLVAAAVSFGSTAFAQEEDPRPPRRATAESTRGEGGAFEIGFRTGYGIPLGRTGNTPTDTSDDKLSQTIKGQIPLWFDAGYRIDPHMYVGASFQYAFGLVPDGQCDSGFSCSVSDLRLDANFLYHFTPEQTADLWVGFGAGYEWLELSVSGLGVSGSGSGTGFEFANFQAGVDIATTPLFVLGPFVSFSMGEYKDFSISAGGQNMSQDITSKALHEWLVFGVRGAFDIRL